MADDKFNISRDRLAAFIKDNDTIRRFEKLFQSAGSTTPENLTIIFTRLEELLIDSGTANSNANLANDRIISAEEILSALSLAPASQPCAEYREVAWTPAVSFATPGDLAVTYAEQSASATKIGRQVFVSWAIRTSAFTHTTAAGNLIISGLPFLPGGASQVPFKMTWQGITKLAYTEIAAVALPGSASMQAIASGSAVARSNVVVADVPSGGVIHLIGQGSYSI